jgi:hypothetical protein
MVSYYKPALADLKPTTLYEYAAQRLLRDTIPRPAAIAADFEQYRTAYHQWWERR